MIEAQKNRSTGIVVRLQESFIADPVDFKHQLFRLKTEIKIWKLFKVNKEQTN